MRKLYFLLPGTTNRFACGGLWAELKTLKLAQQVCEAEVVTYRQREPEHLWLDDLLTANSALRASNDAIFVMSWGFDVAKLAPKLKNFNAIYHAHSAGYGFSLPASVPIITVSRNTLGYWGQRSPHCLPRPCRRTRRFPQNPFESSCHILQVVWWTFKHGPWHKV